MAKDKKFLYTYKMTHDHGFAPNPFGKTLTLATCKPLIRKNAQIGDWVAGFAAHRFKKTVSGEEDLIYLMEIYDIMPLCEYYIDPDFEDKIPIIDHANITKHHGDNIYKCADIKVDLQGKKICCGRIRDCEQIKNYNHDDKRQRKNDLSGKNVLIAKDVYYFGKAQLWVPPYIHPPVPYNRTNGDHKKILIDKEVRKFLDYVKSKKPKIMQDPYDLHSKKGNSSKTKKNGGCGSGC